MLFGMINLPGRTAYSVIVRTKKFRHALWIDPFAGRKAEVLDVVLHVQHTCSWSLYCSGKHLGYALGIGAAAKGMRL